MVCVDVYNWMTASEVGGWVCGWVGEFLSHNTTNPLLIFFNVTWQ